MTQTTTKNNKEDVERIRRRVVSTGGLPTLPEVAMKVLALARNPASSMQDLSGVISSDPPLAGRILKVANSAFYGLRQQVGSLKVALVLLGMKNIISIVTSVSIFKTMNKGDESDEFSREEFWLHSGTCGRVCVLLEKELNIDLEGEGFVCGLIHDMGKIVFDAVFHQDFVEIIKLASQKGIPMYKAEEEVLGVNHSTVGKWLAERWQLPDRISSAIQTHHDEPLSCKEFPLGSVLQISDVLVKKEQLGFCGFDSSPTIEEIEKWPIFFGRTVDWEDISEKICAEFEEVKEFINIAK